MPQQKPVDDWVNVTDDWQDVTSQPVASAKPALPQPEPGWFDAAASYIPQPVKSAWSVATKPLVDYITDEAGNKVFDPAAAANYYDVPSEEDWRIPFSGGATWKGLGAGMLEGAGNVVAGLTSPLNLATMGAFKGASTLAETTPAAARGLTNVGRALSAPVAAHGAATILDPNLSASERAFGVAELAGGAAGVRAPVPKARLPVKGAGALEELPVKEPAAPIEPGVANEGLSTRLPVSDEVLPGVSSKVGQEKVTAAPEPGSFGSERWAEIQQKIADGIATEDDLVDLEVIRRANKSAPRVTPKPGEFDPSTLKELEPAPKPEVEFVDPNTGVVKPASEAKPGDIPIVPEEGVTPEAAPTRARNMILAKDTASDVGRTLPPEIPEAPVTPVLPRNLAGAKPRFGIPSRGGNDYYNPQFSNDLDKALYIIANTTRKSKFDSEYLRFVMKYTGLDEAGARAAGNQVKAAVKAAATGKEPGDVLIPTIYKGRITAEGGGGKPPIPPVKPPTGGELPPEPPKPGDITATADEVTTSLNQRLQDAVDNAGKPNPAAATEISELIDEATEVINRNPNAAQFGIARQVLGANKALLTSYDLSAPGRQGKAFILNKSWWTSWDDMARAWGSKAGAELVQQSIIDHPSGYFKPGESPTGKPLPSFAEKVGLDLASTEEMFRTTFGQGFEKYSGIGKSSRAHTAFLNKLRSDQFVSMMEDAKKAGFNPETDLRLAKAYAKFINDATGRGSLNIGKWKLERNTAMMNDVFFAPKNMSGQIRTWNAVLNPMRYAQYDPVLRKQALRSLFAIASTGLAVGELSRLAGAKVSNDPVSSDFRKIRIGKDIRVDPFGGYQQFPVAAMKFMLGQSTTTGGKNAGRTVDLTAGKFGQDTRGGVAQRFFTNRLSPLGSFVWAWMWNREFDGKPFEVKRALYERVFPIAAKDIWELTQEDPALGAILAVPTMVGLTGTQVYTGR